MPDEREKAAYMGVLKVSRCQGRADLFDSDVEHQHFIEIEVCEAERERHLSNHWIHPGRQIVSVWMSEIQWAQFVSSFNIGEGTPCTVKHIEGKRIAAPPAPRPDATKFQQEITETAKDSLTALQTAVNRLSASLLPKVKAPGKTELGEILSLLETSLREFKNNLPYVEEQFDEHVAAKLSEAKVEFEGYMNHRLRAMGLEAKALQSIKDEAPSPLLTDGGKP